MIKLAFRVKTSDEDFEHLQLELKKEIDYNWKIITGNYIRHFPVQQL